MPLNVVARRVAKQPLDGEAIVVVQLDANGHSVPL
jgi:hypothetical protein